MRILTVVAVFELPNDFDGTTSDALRLLADYHQGNGRPNAIQASETTPHPKKSWEAFLNRPDGMKCVIESNITEHQL